jgi:predicted N-formylglutamate amidohydrolase
LSWDIGIGAVCRLLGQALGAVVIRQNYSRLVIDCNRTPGSETSIADLSELTAVPGNIGLSECDKLARVREIFQPYHRSHRRRAPSAPEAGPPDALISVHSFTPVFETGTRPWHVGVLYNRDRRFAQIVDGAAASRGRSSSSATMKPYSVTDASDYTIPSMASSGTAPCGDRNSPGSHHGRMRVSERGRRCLRACCPRAYQQLTSVQVAK